MDRLIIEKNSMYNYWGKADKDGKFHLLVYHCLDVAAVGAVLHSHHINFFTELSKKVGVSVESFKSLFLFFLAIHDVGKFSVSFQNLRPDLLKELQNKYSSIKYDSNNYKHDRMGWLLYDKLIKKQLKSELKKLFGSIDSDVIYGFLSPLASVVMGHHGKPMDGNSAGLNKKFKEEDYEACKNYISSLIPLFFNQTIIDELNASITSLEEINDELEMSDIMNPITWQLAGFTVICDWIASGDGFPREKNHIELKDYWEKSIIHATDSINNKGVIKSKIPTTNSFENLFPKYAETPTPLQEYCNNVDIPNEPQLWILEDVTGAGKTEAALTLTSRIMSKKLADGCFIALPTMATSNTMYNRMADVYNKLFEENETPSLILSHGSRHMDKRFRDSYRNEIILSEEDGQNIEDDKAFCTRWLSDSSKKSLLSDIGVGTIDQLLLGVLPVKYQSLRFWGMSRKVLIIDEVHACDTYMECLLKNVIEGHASAGGSIILMTATLPVQTRKIYIDAYQNGFKTKAEQNNFSESDTSHELNKQDFPIVTGIVKNGIYKENAIRTRTEVKREIDIKFCEDAESVYKVIQEYLNRGQCVCWMRNTIKDVIKSYNTLIENNIVGKNNIGVYHSRYTLYDRQIKETGVINKFGKDSTPKQRKGRVLVCSQILQESIDVDFDLIISDLAPMDMLIQRLGRMHRHRRDSKGNVLEQNIISDRDKPIFYVHLPPETENPNSDWYSDFFKGASYVYKNTGVLWNTQKLLKEKQIIKMPDDLRYLIEGVFGEDYKWDVPEALFDSVIESSGEDNAKKSIGNLNMLDLKNGYTLNSSERWFEEENVSTRLGDKQVELYLCHIKNGELLPINNTDDFPWEMSCLKVRATMINTPIYTQEETNIIEEFINNSKKKFFPSSIFLIIDKVGDEMEVTVKQENNKEIIVKYSKNFGMEIVK